MAGMKGSFFDNASSSDDGDGVVNSYDENDLSIPLGDEPEEEEEEEVEQPKPKSKKTQEDPEEEEEEFEEEEEEVEDDDEEEEDEDDEDLSDYSKTALDLIEKDVLLPIEGKNYSDDELGVAELVEDTVEQRLKERIAPGYESIIEAMELGIPADEWAANMQTVNYQDADTDDPDTQKHLIVAKLKLEGLDDTAIKKKLDRYERLETLKDEAEESVDYLIKNEETRKAEYNEEVKRIAEDNKRKQKANLEKIQKDVFGTKEIAGFYLNKDTQKELFNYITKPVNPRGETQYMIDRNSPDKLITTAFLAMKGVDSSKLEKIATSKAAKKVRDTLNSTPSDRNTSSRGKQVREKISSTRMSTGMPWDRGSYEVED